MTIRNKIELQDLLKLLNSFAMIAGGFRDFKWK